MYPAFEGVPEMRDNLCDGLKGVTDKRQVD